MQGIYWKGIGVVHDVPLCLIGDDRWLTSIERKLEKGYRRHVTA